MARSTFFTLRLGRDFYFWLGIAAAFLLVVALAVDRVGGTSSTADTNSSEPFVPAEIGRPAPDFTLGDLDGRNVSLSAYKGRPVVLYFWASWCRYCRDEMPRLDEWLQDAQQSADFVLFAVNIMESAATVQETLEALGVDLPVLLDRDGHVARQYLVYGTPSYYFIDAEGILRGRIFGSARPETLRARLAEIVNMPPGAPSLAPPRLV